MICTEDSRSTANNDPSGESDAASDLKDIILPSGPAPASASIDGPIPSSPPSNHAKHHLPTTSVPTAPPKERGVVASAAPALRDLQAEAAAFTPASVRNKRRA